MARRCFPVAKIASSNLVGVDLVFCFCMYYPEFLDTVDLNVSRDERIGISKMFIYVYNEIGRSYNCTTISAQ